MRRNLDVASQRLEQIWSKKRMNLPPRPPTAANIPPPNGGSNTELVKRTGTEKAIEDSMRVFHSIREERDQALEELSELRTKLVEVTAEKSILLNRNLDLEEKYDGVEGAIAHIARHGSRHTEAIVAGDEKAAERFLAGVDAAILLVNASTQFADGGEFGMGAEIGIATGKLHARGPVGAEQLTSYKYIVRGTGQIRP